MKPKFISLLLLSCAYFYAPLTMAANNAPIKPRLIKMSEAVTSSHRINIIKGKINVDEKVEIKNTEEKKKPPHIISTRSCADESNPNQSVNLADSLKAYLSAKNQNASIIDDILYAGQETNIDFELLLVKAMIESDLGRLTEAKNSSARGVFQYIESTWLTLLKRYGEQIGHAEYAKSLSINPNTLQAEINEHSRFSREDLLDLRHDARIAALIKAYQTKDDERAIKTFKNNGVITATDHYIAHMMGIPLAKQFYALLEKESPEILANSKHGQFTRAAKLNPAFFNDHNGNALNAADSYQKFHDIVSIRYDKIRDINAKYGTITLTQSECDLPTVKTARL